MARKSSRTAPTPNRKAPGSIILDHEASHGHPQKQPRIDHSSNGPTAKTANAVTQSSAAEGGSCSAPSDGESDGEGSGAGASDEDGEVDDVGNGGALAPSGLATERCGDQAGRPIGNSEKQSASEQSQRAQKHGASGPGSRSQIPPQIRRSGRRTAIEKEDYNSGDDGYNGVDDITDLEEGEPEVERLDEMDIIESEQCGAPSKMPVRASKAMSETSDTWEGFDIDNSLFLTDVPYFDEQYGRTDQGILDSEVELFQNTSVFDGFASLPSLPRSRSPPARRVHFREPLMPQSDSSDIFSNDEDLNGLFSSSAGVKPGPPELSSRGTDEIDEDDGDNESAGGNSSGYETDLGSTTEEEDVPASATTRPEALLRRPSLSSLGTGTKAAPVQESAAPSKPPSPFKIPATPTRHRRGPRLGTFTTNPTKPCATITATGNTLLITPAKRSPGANDNHSRMPSARTSTANASPTLSQSTFAGTYNNSDIDFSEFSSQVPADPMLAPGSESIADVLLPIGPITRPQDRPRSLTSVFYPMGDMDDIDALCSADDQNDDHNDGEDLLNVEDFIDFGRDSSDDDTMALDTVLPTPSSTSSTAARTQIQPRIPSPTNASNNDLMAHFDKGVIGAFRQGQNQHHSHRPHAGISLNRHAFKSARQALANPSVNLPRKRRVSGGFAPAESLQSIAKRRMMQQR